LTQSYNTGEVPQNFIGSQPQECGGMSPVQVCKEWGAESGQMSWIISIWSVDTISLVYVYCISPLILAMYNSWLPKKWRDWLTENFPKPVQQRLYPRVPRRYCSQDMQQGLRALVYVAMIAGMFNCALYASMILEYMGKGEMNTEWGFGQVVAVSVWMPTILASVRGCIWGE
jgi:hypothetical protein